MALNEVISVYDTKRCVEFRRGLTHRSIVAAAELAIRTDVNRFFEVIISGVQAGVFGRTAPEVQRYFKWRLNPNSNPPLSALQLQDGAEHPYLAWKSGVLFFIPGVVIDLLRKWVNSQGTALPLDQKDLQVQLQSKDYHVKSRTRHGHQQKFGKGATTNQYSWAIDLDKFTELGLQLVTDEDWNKSLYPDGDTSKPRLGAQDWIDPRRGPIFAIVDALEEPES